MQKKYMPGLVFFAEAKALGVTYVGHTLSKYPELQFSALQSRLPFKIEYLGCYSATRVDAVTLRKKLRQDCVNSNWFLSGSSGVLDAIAKITRTEWSLAFPEPFFGAGSENPNRKHGGRGVGAIVRPDTNVNWRQ